jgi:putative ABC transport system permease protein
MQADLWITSKNTPNVDFSHAFPESRVDRVRSVPGVERADNLIVSFMNVKLPTGAEEGMITYALHDFRAWGIPWDVESGEIDDLARGKYMFLDESAEKRYGPFAVGEYREVLGQRLEILGRTRGAKSFTTTPIGFVDYDLAQRLQPQTLTGNTTYVLVRVAPGTDVLAVRAAIAERLPHNDVYTRAEWASRSRGYWLKSTGLGFTMFLTVFLGCLVGLVVVAQTLYTQTMEHLREFGTVKAIGGSNADIYRILARQAGIAAVVGFVLGALPSLGVRSLVGRAGLQVILTPGFVAVVFVGTVVMCLLAAMISFRKVAAIDPGLVFRA